MFILLIPLVSAIYGGESKIIHHFDKCSNLDVIVSGTLEINKTEYNFLNCSEISENKWKCNCYDGFDLIIETKVNTINNYLIEMSYTYEGITTPVSYSTSSSRSKSWICSDWSECIDGNKTMFCYSKRNRGINYTKTEECPIDIIPEPVKEINETKNETIIVEVDVKEPEEKKEEKSYKLLIIILSILALLIITITLFIIRVIRNRRKQK